MTPDGDRKWAKSTLVLVPLFGVHYFVFVGMSGAIDRHETIELVWLFCDQSFASFQVIQIHPFDLRLLSLQSAPHGHVFPVLWPTQGLLVAVLNRLLNGEVRGELSGVGSDGGTTTRWSHRGLNIASLTTPVNSIHEICWGR